MGKKVLGVGIVGCGNIARPYAKHVADYPEMDFRGVADVDEEKAGQLGKENGVRVYSSLDEMLDDDSVDIIVNLTTHHAHAKVTTRCLEADKHVHSEKPLALNYPEARDVVELADRKSLRLGCSPAVFMGEAQQTAMKVVRDGRLGKVRVIYGEANWGLIEKWHPAPAAFYDVGPLFDVGVYPLTMATAMFGPAKRVNAYGRVLSAERTSKTGDPFRVTTPDFVTVVVELENDCVMRLTANFYVGHHSKQNGMEFHGDLGSLHIDSWQNFNASVEFTEYGGKYAPVDLVRTPYPGIEWGRGVLDLARAIRDGRRHRATGEHAAHIVEILAATARSIEASGPVPVTSTFTPSEPMEWAY